MEFIKDYTNISNKIFNIILVHSPLAICLKLKEYASYLLYQTDNNDRKTKVKILRKLGNIYLNILCKLMLAICKIKTGTGLIYQYLTHLDQFEEITNYTKEKQLEDKIKYELERSKKEQTYLNLTPMEKIELGIAAIGSTFSSYEEQEEIIKQHLKDKAIERENAIVNYMDTEFDDMTPETGEYQENNE
jgi:hypothetical protein